MKTLGNRLTTQTAMEAVAWERAPRYSSSKFVNFRIVCADGFTVSVQASGRHYATDSHRSGKALYWRIGDDQPVYPFVDFELGNANAPMPELAEWDSNGVWAWVPREVVADLLDAHGGAVAWQAPEANRA